MVRIVPQHKKPAGYNTAQQWLVLAVFILMLAFFVLLNSRTEPSLDRTREVLSSVHEAFSMVIPLPVPLPADRAAVAASDQEGGDSILRLEHHFNTALPAVDVKRSSSSGVLYVRMNRAQFVSALSEPSGLLALLREAAQPPDAKNQSYAIDITMGRGQAADAAALSGMVQDMARAGIPADHLSIGFADGASDTITILIRPFVRYPIRPVAAAEAKKK